MSATTCTCTTLSVEKKKHRNYASSVSRASWWCADQAARVYLLCSRFER